MAPLTRVVDLDAARLACDLSARRAIRRAAARDREDGWSRTGWYFETDCVASDGPSIDALLASARPISYWTARRVLGSALARRARELGYGGRGGLKLRDDWHVAYYRGTYRGQPAVFFVWSAIEQIFVRKDGGR